MGLILPQMVEVTWQGRTISEYSVKGYTGKWRTKVKIHVLDLSHNSNSHIKLICDYCENVYSTTYEKYIHRIVEKNQKCCCENCWHIKNKEIIKNKYGVDNISQSEEIKKRKAQTNLKNTGYAYNLQNPKIQDKIFKSQLNIWGTEYPMQSPLFKEKMIEKYGSDNPNKIPSIKSRICDTNIKRYGGISPFSSENIRSKIRESMYKNGTVATSIQQKTIYDVYKSYYTQAELNFPIGKSYSGDIVIDDFDIEIDYGGHNLSVKMGYITQEEFNQKQLIRDKIVKKSGYKIIRIISDNLRSIPSDEKLLELLSYSRNFFKENPNRSWIEFDIDNSIIRNALHKDGVFFDYGELRKLSHKSA